MEKFIRTCPSCSKELSYSSAYNCANAEQRHTKCMSCAKLNPDRALTRQCPQCKNTIHYTKIHYRKTAEKTNRVCKPCATLNRRSYSGKNNPFYGRKHKQNSKNTIANKNKKRKRSLKEKKLAAKILTEGRNFRNKSGKSTYDYWLDNFGKEIADQKLLLLKQKQSQNSSGNKNSMFGKPAPQGSGNGWSGWYNDWYFRSIRELSFMIKVIEFNQLNWRVPDSTFKIPYRDFQGKLKNYFPDFIINDRIIEIKPQKLHNTPKVLAKKEAAEVFAKSLNMTYEIIDPECLSQEEIIFLYKSGKIKFLDRYDKKFREKYNA